MPDPNGLPGISMAGGPSPLSSLQDMVAFLSTLKPANPGPSASTGANPPGNGQSDPTTPTAEPGDDLNSIAQKLIRATGYRESSGNYAPERTQKHQAIGKYQFIPSTLRDTTSQMVAQGLLDHVPSPDEFERNPQMQEQVMQYFTKRNLQRNLMQTGDIDRAIDRTLLDHYGDMNGHLDAHPQGDLSQPTPRQYVQRVRDTLRKQGPDVTGFSGPTTTAPAEPGNPFGLPYPEAEQTTTGQSQPQGATPPAPTQDTYLQGLAAQQARQQAGLQTKSDVDAVAQKMRDMAGVGMGNELQDIVSKLPSLMPSHDNTLPRSATIDGRTVPLVRDVSGSQQDEGWQASQARILEAASTATDPTLRAIFGAAAVSPITSGVIRAALQAANTGLLGVPSILAPTGFQKAVEAFPTGSRTGNEAADILGSVGGGLGALKAEGLGLKAISEAVPGVAKALDILGPNAVQAGLIGTQGVPQTASDVLSGRKTLGQGIARTAASVGGAALFGPASKLAEESAAALGSGAAGSMLQGAYARFPVGAAQQIGEQIAGGDQFDPVAAAKSGIFASLLGAKEDFVNGRARARAARIAALVDAPSVQRATEAVLGAIPEQRAPENAPPVQNGTQSVQNEPETVTAEPKTEPVSQIPEPPPYEAPNPERPPEREHERTYEQPNVVKANNLPVELTQSRGSEIKSDVNGVPATHNLTSDIGEINSFGQAVKSPIRAIVGDEQTGRHVFVADRYNAKGEFEDQTVITKTADPDVAVRDLEQLYPGSKFETTSAKQGQVRDFINNGDLTKPFSEQSAELEQRTLEKFNQRPAPVAAEPAPQTPQVEPLKETAATTSTTEETAKPVSKGDIVDLIARDGSIARDKPFEVTATRDIDGKSMIRVKGDRSWHQADWFAPHQAEETTGGTENATQTGERPGNDIVEHQGDDGLIRPNGEDRQYNAEEQGARAGNSESDRNVEVPRAEEVKPEAKPITVHDEGDTTLVRPATGDKDSFAAKYALVEADDVVTSHNPKSFSPDERYASVNQNDYARSKQAQAIIQRGAADPDFQILHSTTSSPVEGPSIVDPNGMVAGGNGRMMLLKNAYDLDPESTKEAVVRDARRFGLDPNAASDMDKPVVVRMQDQVLGKDQESLKRIADLNAVGTKERDPQQEGVSAAARLSDEGRRSVNSLLDNVNTIHKAGQDPNIATGLKRVLEDLGIVTDANSDAFYNAKSRTLTDRGEKTVEGIVLGSALNDPKLIDALPGRWKQSITKAFVDLARVQTTQGWELTDNFRRMVEYKQAFDRYVASGGDKASFDQQENIFGEEKPQLTSEDRTLYNAVSGDQARFRKFMSDYADAASKSGQLDLEMGEITRESTFEELQRRMGGASAGYLGVGLGGLQGSLPSMEETRAMLGEGFRTVRESANATLENTIKPAVERGGNFLDQTVKLFVPTRGVNPEGLNAIMEAKGDRDMEASKFSRAFERTEDYFNKLSQADQVAFIDNYKGGKSQASPELLTIDKWMHSLENELYKAKKLYKPSLAWKENHFTVFWDKLPDPVDISGTKISPKNAIRSRRPLEGTKTSFFQQTLPDLSAGLDRGGIPISYNPLTLFKIGYTDDIKFLTAQSMWENLGKINARKFVEYGYQAPEGYERLDDRLAKQYFPSPTGDEAQTELMPAVPRAVPYNLQRPENLREGPVRGQWFVREGEARLLNNFLSRDLIRAGKMSALGQTLFGLKNNITGIELGLSPFHAVFELIEGTGTKAGIGLTKIWNVGVRQGKAGAITEGLKELASAPAAGVTYAKAGSQFREMAETQGESPLDTGAKEGALTNKFLVKTFEKLGGADQALADFFHAGGRFHMDEAYKLNALQGFKEAYKQNDFVGALLKTPFAANERAMSLLFDRYIPALKAGVWLDDYSNSIEDYSKELETGTITRDELARNAMTRTESKFGEMNFDNLFWNRTLKSALQLAFRSVTWKLGNVKLMGGAIVGQGRLLKDAFVQTSETGQNSLQFTLPRLDPRMGWLMGMSMTTAVIGTVIQKAFTGQYPQSLRDLVFPQYDKNGGRLSLPTYFRDAVSLWHSPSQYVAHSMSGFLSRGIEDWINKDFYNNNIVGPDDNWFEKGLKLTAHMINPAQINFMASGFSQMTQSEAPLGAKLLHIGGFTNAPAYITQTDAESTQADILREKGEIGGKNPAEQETSKVHRDIVNAFRSGNADRAMSAISKNKISTQEARRLFRSGSMTKLQSGFSQLNTDEASRVYDKANPQERDQLKALFMKKIAGNQEMSMTEKIELAKRYELIQ